MHTLHTESAVRRLCFAAAAAALVFLFTLFTQVPIPLGYAHLGDAVIFLTALLLPRREAGLAAAVGSALADLASGFPIWMIPTFLIKYGMAEIAGCAAGKTRSALRVLIGFTLSSLWLAVGYTLFGAVLYGSLAAGLASAPGLLLEGAVNTAAAFAAWLLLRKL